MPCCNRSSIDRRPLNLCLRFLCRYANLVISGMIDAPLNFETDRARVYSLKYVLLFHLKNNR